MRARAAVILIEKDKIALIERHRSGRHYFVFPGGKIELHESPAEAAIREAREELGLEVKPGQMVAEVWFLGSPQFYFLTERIGGKFGEGTGHEMKSQPTSKKGSYRPVWMPTTELLVQPVLPRSVAELVKQAIQNGWSKIPYLETESQAIPE